MNKKTTFILGIIGAVLSAAMVILYFFSNTGISTGERMGPFIIELLFAGIGLAGAILYNGRTKRTETGAIMMLAGGGLLLGTLLLMTPGVDLSIILISVPFDILIIAGIMGLVGKE